MNKIEQVAKALAETDGNMFSYEDQARAAIEAMREPTGAMVASGLNSDAWADAEGGATAILTSTYSAMIDAALKEGA